MHHLHPSRAGISDRLHPRGSELPPERVGNFAAHLSWKSNYCIFFFCIVVVDPVRFFYKNCCKTEEKKKKCCFSMRKPLQSGINQEKPETPQGWEELLLPGDLWTCGCHLPVRDVEKEGEIFLFGCQQPHKNPAEKGGAAAPP